MNIQNEIKLITTKLNLSKKGVCMFGFRIKTNTAYS